MIYDWAQEHSDEQAEAQAIIDAEWLCARGEHRWEPTDLWDDDGLVECCEYCGLRKETRR